MTAQNKELDWTDRGWLDFESRMLEGDETRSQVLLLKEAWLHGARTAIDQAQAAVNGTVGQQNTDLEGKP